VTFIEAHHRDFGVALFIMPRVIGAMILSGVACVASLLLG
jgi:hypothetical protein